ncbi:hypothetical protein [Streptomyces sp. NPDC002187]|uniref:hypothetical protein n=1 Tax=Streptomyces sp. NPDC002187 TaxID=3364637 RepID=UPI00367CDA9B
MRTRTTATVILLTLTGLTACTSGETDGGLKPDPKASATTRIEAPAMSDKERDKAREAAGLPPEPEPAARQAFLDGLNAIDPRIIKPGKEDQAVSRGLNQCMFIKSYAKDRDKLVQSTLERFTVTTRLPEIATPETGGKILDAVHKHICPDF